MRSLSMARRYQISLRRAQREMSPLTRQEIAAPADKRPA